MKTKGQRYFEKMHGWNTVPSEVQAEWEAAAEKDTVEDDDVDRYTKFLHDNASVGDVWKGTASQFATMVGDSPGRAGKILQRMVNTCWGASRIRGGKTWYEFPVVQLRQDVKRQAMWSTLIKVGAEGINTIS